MQQFSVEMDRDIPEGVGYAIDGFGNATPIAFSDRQPPPAGTVKLLVSIEDFGKFLRMRAVHSI